MSSASKCDRCGKFYEKNQNHKSNGRVMGGTITGVATVSGKSDKDEWFDLCDDCISDFMEFMNGKELANEPQEDIQKDELLEILDKMDLFNQRAGRELWSEKNREVQDIDISNISDDIEKLRSYIAKAQPIVRSAEQRIETVKNIGLIG